MLAGLRACSKGRLAIADSRAGMHIVVWLTGRSRAEGEALIAHAVGHGLGLHPISPYYLAPPDRAGLLMGFASLSVLEIEEAVQVFARCLDEMFPVSAKPRLQQRARAPAMPAVGAGFARLISVQACDGPRRSADSQGSKPTSLPICAAAMPQLASAIASTVAATPQLARIHPAGTRARRSKTAASIAATTAIQLACWSRA